MKPGDLIKLKKDYLDPHWTHIGLVIKWTRKHQYKVVVLWDTGEVELAYIKDLEIVSESR